MTLHREGTRYVILATVLWAAIGYLSYRFTPVWIFYPLNILLFLLWFWILWFFRIPARNFSTGDQTVVAPADGKVVVIEECFEPEFFKEKRLQVSIFMSPLNVHVNRSPIKGIVRYMKYHPGKYLVAWHPKSSTDNERTSMVVDNGRHSILLRQVAGALARRICYYVKEGQQLDQNQEFGFIRFGSRVDLYLPLDTEIDVKIGEAVQGGITKIGRLS
jgi:phosphatidylserine decarboxylase